MRHQNTHCETPRGLFDWADMRWGPFAVDAAAEEWNAKCPFWYGPGAVFEDALSIDWDGRVWLNPPWSDVDTWVRKAWAQVQLKNAELVCCLLPTRTGQKWFHEIALPHAHIHWIRGRVKFGARPGHETRSGGFEDCAFFVFERPLQASELK